MDSVRLAEVVRQELTESMHRGSVAVVDHQGNLLAYAGDPGMITYIRSAAKPIQAVTVLESGAAAHYGFTPEEIALLASSHSGEEGHIRVLMQILDKIGLSAGHLQCGTHLPFHREGAGALMAKGLKPTVFHCNCSGKHAGMLTLARFKHWSLEEYYLMEHPVQKLMLQTVADFTGLSAERIPLGVDGCGVPVFAVPLEKMALAYARLVQPAGFNERRKGACESVVTAMLAHPFIISGTGRLTTELMTAAEGKLVAKDGAEGVYCMGIPRLGWGIAVKIEDGHTRALGPVILHVLQELNILSREQLERLSAYAWSKLKNFRGETVGEIRPAASFRLEKIRRN